MFGPSCTFNISELEPIEVYTLVMPVSIPSHLPSSAFLSSFTVVFLQNLQCFKPLQKSVDQQDHKVPSCILIPTPFVSCLAFSTDHALMIQTIDSSLCPVDSSVAGRMNLEGCRAELKIKKSFTRLSVLQMQAQRFRLRERVTKLSQDSWMSRHNLGRQTSLIISSCYIFHYDSRY